MTHYEALGVASDATTDQIRSAYRKLAREHHPDRFSDPAEKAAAEQRFTTMTEAFNTLTDATRRGEYDAKIREAASGEKPAEKEARGYARAAAIKLEQGEPREAVRLLRAALHLDPSQAQYHASLARALEADSSFGEAARQWEETIKLEPYNARYHRLAGQCFEKAGMQIRARRMYEGALKWDKNDSVSAEALKRLSGEEKKTGLLGSLFKRS